ncbi:MAG TPA: 4-hydroxy-tetrahydrodipicolinate synthase [Spirochaetota bacterium]|nr:4-hydroxy-tetrahydrodipicolinate synthase [Spirochaetota bacterium]
MFKGVFTALVTPFRDDKIDYTSLEGLIEAQVKGGVDGVVPVGTTGESPTLSFEEHKEYVKRVVAMVDKRVKVIAGTGSNSTREAVHLSQAAQEYGVDGVLLVNPYYNRPPQRGLVAHFETVAKSIAIPVILYNIPVRTAVNFLPESILELLGRAPNIVAIKEATGDLVQMMRVIELCGDRLTLLSGDDNLLLPLLAIGGKGVISVLANVLPADMKKIVTLFNEGRFDESRTLFYKILPLCRAMFYETNPIPVKAAMEMMGRCAGDIRLPLVPLSDEHRAKLRQALVDYGVKL